MEFMPIPLGFAPVRRKIPTSAKNQPQVGHPTSEPHLIPSTSGCDYLFMPIEV